VKKILIFWSQTDNFPEVHTMKKLSAPETFITYSKLTNLTCIFLTNNSFKAFN